MSTVLRIGTRGSPLALYQTNWVADRLRDAHPGLEVRVCTVRTTGDADQDRPLSKMGGRGVFTRELDTALFGGDVDMAVHSLKDIPTELPDGIIVAATPAREDPRDVFIGKDGLRLADLPRGARVATGSPRRRAQLRALRPDLGIDGIRGNLDTRLRKLRESPELSGIILARAGVTRLGLDAVVTDILETPGWLPAAGQGAIGVTARHQDAGIRKLLETIENALVACAVNAERALLARVQGGCSVPVGAHAFVTETGLELHGLIAHPETGESVRASGYGAVDGAEALGREVADRLLADGGARILAELRQGS